MKQEIEYIETRTGEIYKPLYEFKQKYGCHEGVSEDKCSVKHIGRNIYLVGYFDFNKNGGSRMGVQNPINKYMLLFPNDIRRVVYK